MIELRIRNLPAFMGKLFSGECFDSFLLEQGEIRAAVTWSVNGRIHPEFYGTTREITDPGATVPAERPGAAATPFLPWSDARPILRDMIKGKRAPLGFALTLQLKPEYVAATLKVPAEEAAACPVSSLKINVRYDGGKAGIITGVGYRSFTMDKSFEAQWDKVFQKFLSGKDIAFDPQ